MTRYEDLVKRRKECRACMLPQSRRRPTERRLRNGSEWDFDPDVVSHWSQWLGHRDPKLLIVGQDFSDAGYFTTHRGCDKLESDTNAALHRLLKEHARIPVKPPPTPDPNAPVYLTNSILCLKDRSMKAPVLDSWVNACAKNHLGPLIRLLCPPVVVAMGGPAWRAVRQHFGLNAQGAPAKITEAAGCSWDAGGARVFAVVHCGPLGRGSRDEKAQEADWTSIGAACAALPRV